MQSLPNELPAFKSPASPPTPSQRAREIFFFSSLSFVLYVLFSKEEAAPFLTDWVSHGTKGPRPDTPQGPAVLSQGVPSWVGGRQPSTAQGCGGHTLLPINTLHKYSPVVSR